MKMHAESQFIIDYRVPLILLFAGVIATFIGYAPLARSAINCERNVTANVVAIDQPVLFNRLGASNVNGMIYALTSDVINTVSQTTLRAGGAATPGFVQLRPDKRPRPLVLRIREGDCLTVNFQNLLTPAANPNNALPNAPVNIGVGPQFVVPLDEQTTERHASFHVSGMQVIGSIHDDGSFVGNNTNGNSVVSQGGSTTYHLYAEHEGVFTIHSDAATTGSDGNEGSTTNLLFGQVIVEPRGARVYRSGVTEEELRLASMKSLDPADPENCGVRDLTPDGHPIIHYEARYPDFNCDSVALGGTGVDLGADVWKLEGKAGLPILNMMAGNEIVHTAIDAIVAGPGADGTWHSVCPGSSCPYPLESVGLRNPTVPNRLEPFRDFASVFHDESAAAQAFPGFYVNDPVFNVVLAGVKDAFMINYGSGGIGSEIIANRLGVGPMHDCLTCAFEEFFLTSFAVGDPAMLVDIPANTGLEALLPGDPVPPEAQGPKASFIPYPDDVANVHHSYIGDFTKFRNTHNGKEQHVFHLHNHQWLYNPNDDNSNYLDAQGIGPGAGYTYEINFGGSGNRPKSAGDAIFHCHFYPHFAQGMWYMWRHHDVFESGTLLEASVTPTGFHTATYGLANGTPMLVAAADPTDLTAPPGARVRAIPDGEVVAGAPIAALVPLPGKPMAPLPGKVQLVPNPLTTIASTANPATTDPLNPPTVPVGSLARVVQRDVNPGYPFWIAGIEDTVGQRPPTPPLDMVDDKLAANLASSPDDDVDVKTANGTVLTTIIDLFGDLKSDQAAGWDGGLPRASLSGYAAGGKDLHNIVTRLDFTKTIGDAQAVFFPEAGTDVEKVAMAYHALRCHDSYYPNGASALCTQDTQTKDFKGGFITNGQKPAVGAPYHEPCADDNGMRLAGGKDGHFFSADFGTNVTGHSVFDADHPRIYKGANIQYDAVLNKVGYHYPQQRILALWNDVVPIITKNAPGQPLVIRNNTFDCTVYHHTNLVPEVYELDDYQVRTPTDIIGQHIHLPKWDLTTADGAANGWNYEDGTLSPGAVRERIFAANCYATGNSGDPGHPCPPQTPVGGIGSHVTGMGSGALPIPQTLAAQDHPYFNKQRDVQGNWLGARTTTQRWFFDPVVNTEGVDRGLGIIFTHDHYGPSTHQQIGLYATVLTEPAGSRWVHNETGKALGQDPATGKQQAGRTDGGPTAWQAAILPQAGTPVGASTLQPFREFYLEYSDFQHAYEAGVYVGADQNGVPIGGIVEDNAALMAVQNLGNPNCGGTAAEAFRCAINPPNRAAIAPVFPDLYEEVAGGVLPGCPERPCPTAIDVQDPGMMAVNYRNEPVALRVFDPAAIGPDNKPGAQTAGPAGDLAFALQSRRDRAIALMNNQPTAATVINGTRFPPPINTSDVGGGDPFTPMIRTFAGDMIRIKMQAGGDEEEHNAAIHGVKWLQAGSGHGKAPNSGWRGAQAGGISEQFTLSVPIVPAVNGLGGATDYGYTMDASMDGWWSGMWGLMRAYNTNRKDLFKLPTTIAPVNVNNANQFDGVCPKTAPVRNYDVTAVLANDVLPANADVTIQDLCPGPDCVVAGHAGAAPDAAGGTLVYNPRTDAVAGNIIPAEGAAPVPVSHNGPIHDPTAMLYIHTADLTVDPVTGAPNGLQPGVKVEPLVLRAAAGECINVTLRNRLLQQAVDANGNPVVDANGGAVFADPGVDVFVLDPAGALLCGGQPCTVATGVVFDSLPELPTFGTLLGVTKRDRGAGLLGATTFQTNLLQASSQVGLHSQLVASDSSRDQGVLVGSNNSGVALVPPGGQKTYKWYAGDIDVTRVKQGRTFRLNLVATPVEFGGSNLMPADKIKQGMKSLVGQLVVEPEGAIWNELGDDTAGRQTATVCPKGTTPPCTMNVAGSFRDFSTVISKGLTQYYALGEPVEHMNGEGIIGLPEDSQENSAMAINYGIDPLWFRLGILPNSAFGNAATLDSFGREAQFDIYSKDAISPAGDPATPVFTAVAGKEMRMRLGVPAGTNRGTTFQLHGHVWQRDPYVCPGSKDGLAGRCATDVVGSQMIGDNPLAFHQGGQESINAPTHFDIVVPSAGGGNEVPGDYLFRDTASFGNASGLWGLVRVQ